MNALPLQFLGLIMAGWAEDAPGSPAFKGVVLRSVRSLPFVVSVARAERGSVSRR